MIAMRLSPRCGDCDGRAGVEIPRGAAEKGEERKRETIFIHPHNVPFY